MKKLLIYFTNLFPVWVLLAGALALFYPKIFSWFRGEMIVWGLAVIMLGMGITLKVDDFKNILHMPKAVAAGFIGQYSIMPAAGWSIAHLLNLDSPFAVGLILVSCCPGGTASNVVTYLARGNVALSVVMTTCSTCAAVLMTPLLTKFLAGTYVPVDAFGLFWSTFKVVIIPIVIGVGLNSYSPKIVNSILPIAPPVAVAAIVMICASIIGQNAAAVKHSALRLLFAVFLLHASGFWLGYYFSKLLGFDTKVNRTISIEVGMQNSGLGVVLAQSHFANPLTAVPCAISATMHSIIGSILAGIWRLGIK